MRLAVIGAGAWGTALALVSRRAGSTPMLWARDRALVAAINERRENPRYLPGISLDPMITATINLATALKDADAVLLAVPAQFLRGVLRTVRDHLRHPLPLLHCAKGIETGSLATMSQIGREELPECPFRQLHSFNMISIHSALGNGR